MRKILAANVTEDVFQGYKVVYQDAADTDAQLVKEIKTLVERHKALKTQIASLKDRNAKQAVIAQADEIKQRHELAKRERAYTKSVAEGELKMMKNVHNFTQFKALVQTCSFWGDTWAISTLERVLNIKIILFSEESFKAGDLDNVLTCGQLNDTVLEEKGVFKPDYYILAIYLGYHYQMISYKDQGALTFKELPYDIKTKVVDKCLERLAGPYYIIPDFREFMEGATQAGLAPANESATPAGLVPATLAPATLAPANESATPASLVPATPMQSDLFNNATIFQFYINSTDKRAGKGAGEILAEGEKNEYKELERIPHWRQKLSNLWPAPFTLDGYKWLSVEHYYEGSKYKRGSPEFYLQFTLDSESVLAKDPALAKGAAKKFLQNTGTDINIKKIIIDDDFFGLHKRGVKEMEAAQYAKFSQHADLKDLLKLTKKAKLQHFLRGSQPEVSYELMNVRNKLSLEN
jgi:hypothetical protein